MTALFVGETLSGMLPGFAGLAQGIEGDQCVNDTRESNKTHSIPNNNVGNFGPSVFFMFLFAMMFLCGLAFLALNYMPFAKKQHVVNDIARIVPQRAVSEEERQSLLGVDILDDNSRNVISKTPEQSDHPYQRRTWHEFIYLLIIQAWINCLANGVLPSIQAYACKPYGNKAYHLGRLVMYHGCTHPYKPRGVCCCFSCH
jgi:riboflavin transporter 2